MENLNKSLVTVHQVNICYFKTKCALDPPPPTYPPSEKNLSLLTKPNLEQKNYGNWSFLKRGWGGGKELREERVQFYTGIQKNIHADLISFEIGETWRDGACLNCSCVLQGLGAEPVCKLETCKEKMMDENYVTESILNPDQCCPLVKRIACKANRDIYQVFKYFLKIRFYQKKNFRE